MHRLGKTLRQVVVVGLPLLAPAFAGGPLVRAEPIVLAQAGEDQEQEHDQDQEQGEPPSGRRPVEHAREGEEAEPEAPVALDRHRSDPIDAAEAERELPPHPAAAAYPDHDVVVCEAGCDGPRGTVVYKRGKQKGLPPG